MEGHISGENSADVHSRLILVTNQTIDQSFLYKNTLTQTQTVGLKKISNAAFSTVFEKFKLIPKWFARASTPEIELMDLNRDGQPEVYMSDQRTYLKESRDYFVEIVAGYNLLLTFKNNQWVSLLKGYWSRHDDEVETEGVGNSYI